MRTLTALLLALAVLIPPVAADTDTLLIPRTLRPVVGRVLHQPNAYQQEQWYSWYSDIGTWRAVPIGGITVGMEGSGADFILPHRIYALFKLTLVHPKQHWNHD